MSFVIVKKINFPLSNKKFEKGVFNGNARCVIEIMYSGSSKDFIPFAVVTEKMVEVPMYGSYDKYPYYIDDGVRYQKGKDFDKRCCYCEVLSSDGIVLKYGYGDPNQKKT